MFAKRWEQNKEIRKFFYQRIEEKIKRDKERMANRIVKPITKFQFETDRLNRKSQGQGGEDTISNTLWFWLPRNYRYFDDVVLEPEKDQFIQLDHIVIAPQGIFIVETKTWKGIIFASEIAWRLKVGRMNWVEINNPVKQNERHARLFKKWLNDNFPDKSFLKETVYPVVALKKTAWFKADETVKMPIVLGGVELVSYIKSIKGNAINNDLSETICEGIKNAKPYEEKRKITFKEGITKYGKKYVRVWGTLKDAQKVRENYEAKGHKPTEVRADKRDKNVFYFYIQ